MQIKDINQFVQQIVAALPPGLQQLPQNFQQHLREAITGALSKCDLVSREEFDAQTGVLLKTRAKLELLEKQITELENTLSDQ